MFNVYLKVKNKKIPPNIVSSIRKKHAFKWSSDHERNVRISLVFKTGIIPEIVFLSELLRFSAFASEFASAFVLSSGGLDSSRGTTAPGTNIVR